ncbi:hypothetical protein [Motiliproteus sp. MSK22-1]|uniref:hypothetical protein n=1 Tax=Motiliproteus sp. MSK22-1 TaxID=1897630 RepID=UPI0009758395|nr:hypothetical protein [Motiliproteus sp. MSK22-1]OMH38976.1 hypothetical protein BGP75_04415 [Motiliproteus sp. MSK22-1]
MDFKLHRVVVPVALLVPLSAFVYFQFQQIDNDASVELVSHHRSGNSTAVPSDISSPLQELIDKNRASYTSDRASSLENSAPAPHQAQTQELVEKATPSFDNTIRQLQLLTDKKNPAPTPTEQKVIHADKLIADTDRLLASIGLKPPSQKTARTSPDTDEKFIAATERLLRLQQLQ